MANFLNIFKSGILKEPGDELSARVTPTGRKVMKLKTDNGNQKRSITVYNNGTTVETKTTKR